jgi:Beta-lactamase
MGCAVHAVRALSAEGERSMGKLDGKIDAVFADMNVPQHPGAALLVIDHDEIVYSKCYGLADLETQRPITTDTSFYLASISKQYTAMAIMLLAEDGRLSHEDRLPAFVPADSLMGRGNFRTSFAAPYVGSAGLCSFLQLQRGDPRMDPRNQWHHQRGRARTEAQHPKSSAIHKLGYPISSAAIRAKPAVARTA